LSSGLVDAQYYMYTPGSSILPYMNSQFDTYGCGLQCFPYTNTICGATQPFFDATMCQNIPSTVSMTPWIQANSGHIYSPPGTAGTIYIDCGFADYSYTKNYTLFLTTNGTLPNIFGKPWRGPLPGGWGIGVNFLASDPPLLIVARCVEDNKTASRIAYAWRIPWDPAANGSWCPTNGVSSMGNPRYHELNLPRCNPAIYGALCDGQTIISTAASLSTPPIVSPSIPQGTVVNTMGAASSSGGGPISTTITATRLGSDATLGHCGSIFVLVLVIAREGADIYFAN
jgi:hypothetical protein